MTLEEFESYLELSGKLSSAVEVFFKQEYSSDKYLAKYYLGKWELYDERSIQIHYVYYIENDSVVGYDIFPIEEILKHST